MADLNTSERDGDGNLAIGVNAADIDTGAVGSDEIATDAVDTAEIKDGAVVNADVNAAAAIAWSKMAALTDGQLLVGNGSNVATDVAVSGDATLANTGALTVTGSTGNFTVSGFLAQTATATSGAGAVAVTGSMHEVTTTGTGDALTLANGTAGQRLSVVYVAEGAGSDTAVITPTTLAGGSTVTLNNLGDSADLIYSATGGWYVLGLGGAAAVA